MTRSAATSPKLHAVRSAAARAGNFARWGGRGPSVSIRVDPEAAAALDGVPRSRRREVASKAIIAYAANAGRA